MGLHIGWVGLLVSLGWFGWTQSCISRQQAVGWSVMALARTTGLSSTILLFSNRLAQACSWVQERECMCTRPTENYHFCHVLLAKANHKTNPDPRREEIDSTSWWKLLQSHIARTWIQGGVENVAIFVNNLPQGIYLSVYLQSQRKLAAHRLMQELKHYRHLLAWLCSEGCSILRYAFLS